MLKNLIFVEADRTLRAPMMSSVTTDNAMPGIESTELANSRTLGNNGSEERLPGVRSFKHMEAEFRVPGIAALCKASCVLQPGLQAEADALLGLHLERAGVQE